MNLYFRIVSFGATSLRDPRTPHCRGSEIIQRHITLGSTPLDEGFSCRRDLFLTTHNIHKRQISMPPAGFETIIPSNDGHIPTFWPRGHWDRLRFRMRTLCFSQ
jgi:hypothetical protein